MTVSEKLSDRIGLRTYTFPSVLSNASGPAISVPRGPRIPKVQGPYPLEVTSWGHFSGICLGKEDSIVYAGKDMIAL